jgi:Ras-related protein Rab-32
MVDSMFKILVVGNAGVGKTSLIKRYAHNVFSDQYQSTIGVDFALKVLKVGSTHGEAEEIVRLQLWDIAGQEQFGAMTRVSPPAIV